MGAAAQFNRVAAPALPGTAHRQHPHFVAIFLAKQRQRARFDRIIGGHQPGGNLFVGADFGVHLGFDCRNVIGRERRLMREIKPQALLGNHAAFLRHVPAKPIAQSRVDKVRGRMVGADTVTTRGIDLEFDRVTHRQTAGLNAHLMRVQPAERLGRVGDGGLEARHIRH